MGNVSSNTKDGVEVKKPDGNAEILEQSESAQNNDIESTQNNDTESSDYLQRKLDDAEKELNDMQEMLEQGKKAIEDITEKRKTLLQTDHDEMRLMDEQIKQEEEKIQSLEIEIEQKSMEFKMLREKVFKRFDTGCGIIIQGIFPKEFSCDVVPWTSDERLNIINERVFPDEYKLETDFYNVRESNTGGPLDGNVIPTDDLLLKVVLPKRENSQYKCAVRFNDTWTFHEHQDNTDEEFGFKVDGVESVCVISMIPEENHTIGLLGSQFISTIDNRMQVIFPPNAVDKEENIGFKTHPVDMKCLVEKYEEDKEDKEDEEDEAVRISAITFGLSAKHRVFNRFLELQLPLHYPDGSDTNEDDCEYRIFKWNDDGSFKFVDIKPVILNNMASFQANSFSSFGVVKSSRSTSTSSLGLKVQEAYGLQMWCKILFFVGKKTKNCLPIMLECVRKERVTEVCENRKKYGYHIVQEWTSKDFFLIPDKTIITVDVKGKFRIPKESKVKHPKFSFIPVARENFTRFPVEIKSSGSVYGVLSIRDNKGAMDEILYDPDSSRNLPFNMTIRDELVANRNDQIMISRSSTARNQRRRSGTHKCQSDQNDDNEGAVVTVLYDRKTEAKENRGKSVNPTTNFFSEKGLLSLSEKMSPDTMLKFCLHMEMTSAQYEIIRQRDGYTALGNLKVFQTALDQQPQKGKLNLVLEALTQAGQKKLAEKVAELHSNKKPLHTI